MDYLREDVPGLEVEYAKFIERVEEETEDPQWNIENHPAREILEQFPPEFSEWVNGLMEVLVLKRGGYPFKGNDLSIQDWKALGILENYQKNINRQGKG